MEREGTFMQGKKTNCRNIQDSSYLSSENLGNLLLGCVCVCLYPFTVKASSVYKMSDTCLRGTDQRCCVVSIIRCASAKFLHLGI